jgi:hypothetical protein
MEHDTSQSPLLFSTQIENFQLGNNKISDTVSIISIVGNKRS